MVSVHRLCRGRLLPVDDRELKFRVIYRLFPSINGLFAQSLHQSSQLRCGIPEYASAQLLDFLDLEQKFSFMNWKPLLVSIRSKNNSRMDTILGILPNFHYNKAERSDS
jgi:hypothetical protein